MTSSKSLVVWNGPLPRARKQRRAGTLLLLTSLIVASLGAAGFFFLPMQRVASGPPITGVAPVVVAEPWIETPLPIQVAPSSTISGGVIQIDGLPPLALLSEGPATRPGSWRVPVSKLARLKITAPPAEATKSRLAIALISRDGVVLDEVRPLLAVVPVWRIGSPAPAPANPSVRCPAQATEATQPAAAAPAPAWVWPGAGLEAKSLVRRGDEAMSRGSIGAARQTYEYAAVVMRWSTAALALAATYDPHELAYLAPLVVPDRDEARRWYERARALADARVDFHAQRLGPPSAHGPAEPLAAVEPAPLWVWFGAMEAKTIVRWGDEAVSRGYIEAARQIYEYAAVVMRWPSAALALAATYDPHELAHLAPSVAPEPEKAHLWYERSRELMNARIDFHLRRLGPPKTPVPVSAYLVASCG
jgi:hypothetical protein